MKYVFITGGVVSGLGKGVTAAALAKSLFEMGLSVDILKIDPYLNVDAGTMNPNQHGEVFVTEDGYEADLDLGHYERFTGRNMLRDNNLTAGRVYSKILQNERNGQYLGETIQVMTHVVDYIEEVIQKQTNDDVRIIEIGGTVGDYEAAIFLEAFRRIKLKLDADVLSVHIAFVPFLNTSKEHKTKPLQQSVQKLMEIGVKPDFLIARSDFDIEQAVLEKISKATGVKEVINLEDIDNVYSIVQHLVNKQVPQKIITKLQLEAKPYDFEVKIVPNKAKIVVVGKYAQTLDAYKSIFESIYLETGNYPAFVDSSKVENDNVSCFDNVDGIIIPGGFGTNGIEGKLLTIRYAREHNIPLLGICLGMQLMVIEYARNVMGWKNANSTEFDPYTPFPVVDLMESQKELLNFEGMTKYGGTMRLGALSCAVSENTKLHEIYEGASVISERHRHRYEINYNICKEFIKTPNIPQKDKFVLSAYSAFAEAVELPMNDFFIGVQYHPEFLTRVNKVHPLFKGFIKACIA